MIEDPTDFPKEIPTTKYHNKKTPDNPTSASFLKQHKTLILYYQI